jgi:predicted RNA-binding Zn ribbon-like protein
MDLVNTISWRGAPERQEDHLLTAEDALRWCIRAGVVSEAESTALAARRGFGDVLLPALRAVRDAIGRHLVDVPTPDLPGLEPLIVDAIEHSRLVDLGGQVSWRVADLDESAPARRIVLDLYAYLSDPPGRLGVCADEGCRWAFVDTSKRGDRIWCSSADCGNRHRARRHQALRRTKQHV